MISLYDWNWEPFVLLHTQFGWIVNQLIPFFEHFKDWQFGFQCRDPLYTLRSFLRHNEADFIIFHHLRCWDLNVKLRRRPLSTFRLSWFIKASFPFLHLDINYLSWFRFISVLFHVRVSLHAIQPLQFSKFLWKPSFIFPVLLKKLFNVSLLRF